VPTIYIRTIFWMSFYRSINQSPFPLHLRPLAAVKNSLLCCFSLINFEKLYLSLFYIDKILDFFLFLTEHTAYTTTLRFIFMEIIRGFFAICIGVSLLLYNSSNVEGRYHYHKPKNKSSNNIGSPVSPPPDDTPDPQNPIAPSSPSNPPSIPSDPYPKDPGNTSSGCIFNVMDYGAVGDGSTDDTDAFRQAWKEACGVESGVILAPSGHSFMITSTIFTGPCKPGLVFQVKHLYPCF